ncbi:hypothetical protein [Pseudoroseomonas ludipueritiae]|uniref:Uncharacterized protein n=1 Tax=Pseudoroseomonas ludipueritiae TaxID=198093 RepID=A0ABR7R319_9PROT|nr:hypothetical protein [Pseudoroseomonas ludipueritiae]MBC9176152.1 hypothetical protein [Pseudoroseomonas ludipueritiae]
MPFDTSNNEDDVAKFATELGDLAISAARSGADGFELRQILRFVNQVIQVVDQSFETVYGILVDLRYLSKSDLDAGRHIELQKELHLIRAKSTFRESLEVCSRLRHLRKHYDEAVAPILAQQELDSHSWSSVLILIDEYEGAIIGIIKKTVDDLSARLVNVTPTSLPALRVLATERADLLGNALGRLRDLNSRILGLSGRQGLLELTATNRSGVVQVLVAQNFDQRNSDQRRGMFMGDTFSNISNSTIINRSTVQDAFNKIRSDFDETTAKFILELADHVDKSGNKDAGEVLDQINEELARPQPRKGLLKRSWENLVQLLPTVTAVAGAAGAIVKLFSSP